MKEKISRNLPKSKLVMREFSLQCSQEYLEFVNKLILAKIMETQTFWGENLFFFLQKSKITMEELTKETVPAVVTDEHYGSKFLLSLSMSLKVLFT